MIKEVKMWSASCDLCEKMFELYYGCIALSEKSDVEEEVRESNEWIMTKDDKVYCPDCCQTHWNEDEDRLYAFTKDTESSGAQLLGEVI